MKKIYSNIEKGKLLHQIVRIDEIKGRTNLCKDDDFIQCASLGLDKGVTFRPHKHIVRQRADNAYIPQESWVVIQGAVECIFYDLDDSVVDREILKRGDASFTFYGGHNYLILEDNTIVYEYKTGPYLGQSFDKIFLNENR